MLVSFDFFNATEDETYRISDAAQKRRASQHWEWECICLLVYLNQIEIKIQF